MSVKFHSRLMFSLFFCVFFFVSFLHVPEGYYYTDKSFSDIESFVEEDKDCVIYFARDDCPECRSVDILLKQNNGKLAKDVFRIETRRDPNVTELKEFLKQKKIKKVPTFWSVDTKRVIERQMIVKR